MELLRLALLSTLVFVLSGATSSADTVVEGVITDASTGKPVAARITIQSSDGQWYFPKSAAEAEGSAIRYERRNGRSPQSLDMHTTLSAHPFRVELPPGRYTLVAERGKEYFPESKTLEIPDARVRGEEPASPSLKLTIPLRRWIDMVALGWYSGDTHTHRNPADLPNVIVAEDVNVALPMTDWTTNSAVTPKASKQSFRGDFTVDPVAVDPTHIWFARNTEYEIFSVGEKPHTLGAFLIVNHRKQFDIPVLPLSAVAKQARQEGALIDLEKHNWPWSIAIVPLLNVDLFELANNHHWQSEYGIHGWAEPAPSWMNLNGRGTDDELSWTLYGFQTYYALLNCGFKLRPAAGTANGIHPVPLGFSRVYVEVEKPFGFESWMRGLSAGRCFVTTGPMLLVRVDQEAPGFTFKVDGLRKERSRRIRVTGQAVSEQPLRAIECIADGRVVMSLKPRNERTQEGAYRTALDETLDLPLQDSAWVALRCWEDRPGGRTRFAHTAPWHFTVDGRPNRPRRDEIDWLIARARSEVDRNRDVLPSGAVEELRSAVKVYEDIAKRGTVQP